MLQPIWAAGLGLLGMSLGPALFGVSPDSQDSIGAVKDTSGTLFMNPKVQRTTSVESMLVKILPIASCLGIAVITVLFGMPTIKA